MRGWLFSAARAYSLNSFFLPKSVIRLYPCMVCALMTDLGLKLWWLACFALFIKISVFFKWILTFIDLFPYFCKRLYRGDAKAPLRVCTVGKAQQGYEQHLYISVYFKLFGFVCFIKVYLIFSTSIFVFIIRILYFCIKIPCLWK